MGKELTLESTLNYIDDKYVEFKNFIKSKNPTYCEIRKDKVIFDKNTTHTRDFS